MLILGDSLEKLKELEPNSVDAVVTDPPYGLKFMGIELDPDYLEIAKRRIANVNLSKSSPDEQLTLDVNQMEG